LWPTPPAANSGSSCTIITASASTLLAALLRAGRPLLETCTTSWPFAPAVYAPPTTPEGNSYQLQLPPVGPLPLIGTEGTPFWLTVKGVVAPSAVTVYGTSLARLLLAGHVT
jgi:hypothetical protein